MPDNKYRIIENEPVQLFGRTLYRIVAVKSFVLRPVKGNSAGKDKYPGLIVKRGETGGLIEGEWNLSQEGNCWVGKGAAVFGRAYVSENAWVRGIEKIAVPTVTMRDNTRAFGTCEIRDFAQLRDEASVGGNSVIRQYARVEDCVTVIDSDVGGYVCLFGTCYVKGAEKILDFNARPSRICCPEDLDDALKAVEEARAEKLESYLPTLTKNGMRKTA